MVIAIEDAGFEIRDQIMWVYGSGFPKSHDVAKGITARQLLGSARTEDMRRLAMGDNYEPSGRGRVNYDNGGGSKMNGASDLPLTPQAQQWEGWGTALKPAHEPIVMARKPLIGTVAQNVLRYGTGAINIDGCRVHGEDAQARTYTSKRTLPGSQQNATGERHFTDVMYEGVTKAGRFPANLLHDGSDEVVAAFPGEAGARAPVTVRNADKFRNTYGTFAGNVDEAGSTFHNDKGSAARFFYAAKASKADRAGSKHPTVKPIALMRYLVRMVTPRGGTVLDPFAGSGTTLQAARLEGVNAIGIEMTAEYYADIKRRLSL